MKLTKYEACGNDFILATQKPTDECRFAKRICDRHFGIGADGLLWVEKSECADVRMKYLNADGSHAKMCGNGLRCFTRFVLDQNLIKSSSFTVETDAGLIKVKALSNSEIKIDLMLPREMTQEELSCDSKDLTLLGLPLYPLHLGTLHAVTFVENFESVSDLGPLLTHDLCFPQHTNINFVKIINSQLIEVKTHERGAGWTLACGTGMAASAYIAHTLKGLDSRLNVVSEGGSCQVSIETTHISLQGPAHKIADIEWEEHHVV